MPFPCRSISAIASSQAIPRIPENSHGHSYLKVPAEINGRVASSRRFGFHHSRTEDFGHFCFRFSTPFSSSSLSLFRSCWVEKILYFERVLSPSVIYLRTKLFLFIYSLKVRVRREKYIYLFLIHSCDL